jgi:isomerase DpgB
MKTNPNILESQKQQLLKLNIAEDMSLAELTAQVNNTCEEAANCAHAVVICHLTGSNLQEWPGKSTGIQDINRWERALRRLERLPTATISLASGILCGPALDLLLTNDYRIVSPDFQLRLPVNDGHVWPGMTIHRLTHQIGIARCRQLLLGNCEFNAKQALDMGLVDEISGNTHPRIQAAISRFNSMSGTEIAVRRQLLLEATTTNFEDALGVYLAACDRELRRLQQ